MKKLSMYILISTFLLLSVAPAISAPVPCLNGDLSAAKAAQIDAKGTLDSAVNFLKGNDNQTKALVLRWFGRSDQITIEKVIDVLSRTSKWVNSVAPYCLYANDGSLVEQMTAEDGSIILSDEAGNVYAYVDPGDITKINLGLKFFSAPAIGMNSKLGSIIHEVTHYFITGNTDDIRYGRAKCLQLAKQDPDSAIRNADNFEYFIEEWLKP